MEIKIKLWKLRQLLGALYIKVLWYNLRINFMQMKYLTAIFKAYSNIPILLKMELYMKRYFK